VTQLFCRRGSIAKLSSISGISEQLSLLD
jgi:hypothetical protein